MEGNHLARARKLGRAIVVILSVFCLQACAHATAWRGAGDRLPADSRVVEVEGYIQKGNLCGPTALATLFSAAGVPVPVSVIAAETQNRRLDAALNIDLVRFARSRGFAAPFRKGSLDQVVAVVEQGQAPLLLVRLDRRGLLGARQDRVWHYVVVYGVSRETRTVFLHSGYGRKQMTWENLERYWAPAKNWMMTLGPRRPGAL